MVAYRMLDNHEEAEEAVQNCLRTAANNVPRFEHEGAFRCWLESLSMKLCLLLSKQSVAPPHIEMPEPSRLTGAFSSEVRRISGRGADF
jgi:DNA-directed RNA polymerase specialized sigma24 family protein